MTNHPQFVSQVYVTVVASDSFYSTTKIHDPVHHTHVKVADIKRTVSEMSRRTSRVIAESTTDILLVPPSKPCGLIVHRYD